jgi:hypothetical protein
MSLVALLTVKKHVQETASCYQPTNIFIPADNLCVMLISFRQSSCAIIDRKREYGNCDRDVESRALMITYGEL